MDIACLREVVAVNPYINPQKWVNVVENINTAIAKVRPDAHPFSERSLKDRLSGLLGNFTRDEMEILKKSGTEEEYKERDQLLQELKDLKEEGETVKKDKKVELKRKKETEENEGEIIRRNAMEGMNKAPKDEVTPKKTKFDVGEYLQKKLDLEARKLDIEKEKQAVEKERQTADSAERRVLMDILAKFANNMK